MNTVSLCMIVRDEEEVLARCLDSIADLVDEVIIVDTGSTDRTREIAASYTDKVYDFAWTDDFAAARNFAFEQAGCDYCMWLDADDILTEADRQKFAALKRRLSDDVDVVMMRYNTGFDADGYVTFAYYRERIIRNGAGMRWHGAVHEYIETHGRVIYDDCAITHKKLRVNDEQRNLRIFEGLLAKGEKLDAREQFYYARELYYHQRYREAIQAFADFLAAEDGWLENKIDACRHIAYCRYAMGEAEAALDSLLHSFAYDVPRAEVCCEVAGHFFERENWERAAYWYLRALDCERRDEANGFVSPDAYGYTPCIQLCVCYSRLGRQAEAAAYNERAAQFKPESAAVAHNRAYFAGLQ